MFADIMKVLKWGMFNQLKKNDEDKKLPPRFDFIFWWLWQFWLKDSFFNIVFSQCYNVTVNKRCYSKHAFGYFLQIQIEFTFLCLLLHVTKVTIYDMYGVDNMKLYL